MANSIDTSYGVDISAKDSNLSESNPILISPAYSNQVDNTEVNNIDGIDNNTEDNKTDIIDDKNEDNNDVVNNIGDNQSINRDVKEISKCKLYNVIMLGASFMFLFTAFQTCSMVQTLVLEGANNETNGTSGNGYTSLSIIYATFAASNWLAPSILALLGVKTSMIVSSACYCIFIGLFLKPMRETLYFSSVLVGVGAAVLWTGQGKFLTINSNADDMTRNTGIFWALFQSSLLWGNLLVFFQFSGEIYITRSTRTVLFIVLTTVAVIGTLMMFSYNTKNLFAKLKRESNAKEAFVKSVKLLFTKNMLLLSVIFFYTGVETSFWSSVFVTSVGHTTVLENSKKLTGLCGLLLGIGEILGGLFFSLLGNTRAIQRLGRNFVILFGLLLHCAAYFLIFLMLAPESPMVDTDKYSYMHPNQYIILFCALILGLGDSCFNTQIYPILRLLYSEDISSACAIFKFIQSLAAAATFVYSQFLFLHWQLLIATILCLLGSCCFFLVSILTDLNLVIH